MSRTALAASILAEAGAALALHQPSALAATAACFALLYLGYTYNQPLLCYASYVPAYFTISLALTLLLPQEYAFALGAIVVVGLAERVRLEVELNSKLYAKHTPDREAHNHASRLSAIHLRTLLVAVALSAVCMGLGAALSTTPLVSQGDTAIILVFSSSILLLAMMRVFAGRGGGRG